MEIRWSPEAAEDLEHIVNRIRRDNPHAARQVAVRLYDSCASLESLPNRGRNGRIAGTRELVLPPLPYIIVYRVRTDAVEIVRIYHSAQNWP
jgi:toxin ParE1/3/4